MPGICKGQKSLSWLGSAKRAKTGGTLPNFVIIFLDDSGWALDIDYCLLILPAPASSDASRGGGYVFFNKLSFISVAIVAGIDRVVGIARQSILSFEKALDFILNDCIIFRQLQELVLSYEFLVATQNSTLKTQNWIQAVLQTIRKGILY